MALALLQPPAAPLRRRRAARPPCRAAATVEQLGASEAASSSGFAPPPRPQAAPWTPLALPSSFQEFLAVLTSPATAALVADRQASAYVAYCAARCAFFTSQALLAAAATRSATGGAERLDRQGVDISASDGVSGLRTLLASQAELYRRELGHVQAGLYRAPYDMAPAHRQWQPGFILDKTRRLLRVSGETMARRATGAAGGRDVLATATDAAVPTAVEGVEGDALEALRGASPDGFAYPAYYLQNFHWQTDGWMSVRSARSYEHQTETLFQGCQDTMQRAALAPLGRFMAGRAPEATRLLEVAAGTGRFHTFIKDNYPKMRTTCSDLSPYYLAEARENMEYFAEFDAAQNPGRAPLARTAFVQAAAEALPFPDAAFDVVMNVYLLHEMPAAARAAAAAEWARVCAPGGLLVVNDSLQAGDRVEMDAVMPLFPANYHEPYYTDYTRADIPALFGAAGFELLSVELAHVSKVWAFVRK